MLLPAAANALYPATATSSGASRHPTVATSPRAVVFGSAIVLVPWYLLCARVAGMAPCGAFPLHSKMVEGGRKMTRTKDRAI